MKTVGFQASAPATFQLDRELRSSLDGVDYINMIVAVLARGPLDISAASRAWQEIQARHEALYARLAWSAEDLVVLEQKTPPQARLPVVDASRAVNGARQRRVFWRAVRPYTHAPFVFDRGPLVRAAAIRLSSREHLLLWVMAHAIFDIDSWQVFVTEFLALYNAFTANAPLPPPPPAHALRKRALAERLPPEPSTTRYWRQRLAGRSGRLPLDPHRRKAASDRYDQARAELGELRAPTVRRLLRLAGETGGSIATVALAACACATHACFDDRRLLIAVCHRNRRQEDRQTIGCLMDFLPVAIDLADDQTFAELATAVRNAYQEAKRHRIASAHLERLLTDPCDVMFNCAICAAGVIEGPVGQAGQTTFETIEAGAPAVLFPAKRMWWGSQIDIDVRLLESGKITGEVSYNARLLDHADARKLAATLTVTLKLVSLFPRSSIARLYRARPRAGDSCWYGDYSRSTRPGP
jgi:hypothetical protein